MWSNLITYQYYRKNHSNSFLRSNHHGTSLLDRWISIFHLVLNIPMIGSTETADDRIWRRHLLMRASADNDHLKPPLYKINGDSEFQYKISNSSTFFNWQFGQMISTPIEKGITPLTPPRRSYGQSGEDPRRKVSDGAASGGKILEEHRIVEWRFEICHLLSTMSKYGISQQHTQNCLVISGSLITARLICFYFIA